MWILHQNFPKSETFDKSDHGESWAREPISLLTLRWLAKTCPKEAILRNFYCNVVIFIYVYIHSVILLFRDIPKYSSKFSDLRQASIPWPLFGQNGQNGQGYLRIRWSIIWIGSSPSVFARQVDKVMTRQKYNMTTTIKERTQWEIKTKTWVSICNLSWAIFLRFVKDFDVLQKIQFFLQ